MKRILNFKELFESATNFPKEISDIPSHEELNKLPSFLMFKSFMPILWKTGNVAYRNGTRSLGMGPIVSIDGKNFCNFNFYPFKGEISKDPGGYTVSRRNLVTTEDWNEAVEDMSNYCLSELMKRMGFTNLKDRRDIAKLKAGKNPELLNDILTQLESGSKNLIFYLESVPGFIEYLMSSILLSSENPDKALDLIYKSPYKFKIMNSIKKNSPEAWKILKNKSGDPDSVEASADMGDLGF